MIDAISGLRAYALKHARALRILRSVKAQGQADAYQDMGARLIALEQIQEAREKLVQDVIRLRKAQYSVAMSRDEELQRNNLLHEALDRLAEHEAADALPYPAGLDGESAV